MGSILFSVCWQFALLFLDDIVVFLKPTQDHIDQVRRVLQLLYRASVTLKLKECKLYAEQIDYLGHVIRPGCLELSEHTTDAVVKLIGSTVQMKLCSFLGLCKVSRRFVPNFTHVAVPLKKKLGKDHLKYFGTLEDKMSASAMKIKKALISPTVLALPKTRAK